MTTLTMGKPLRVAMGEKITEMAATNDRLVVLDGDTAVSTRVDIFQAEYPERFFQTGIAEMNMLGMAAGMATVNGLIPIVSTFSAFIASRAHDSIRVLIAQPNLNVKLMSGYSGLLAGMTGKTHLLFDDVSIMRAMANIESGGVANAKFILEGLVSNGGDHSLRPLAAIYLRQLSENATELIAAAAFNPWEEMDFPETDGEGETKESTDGEKSDEGSEQNESTEDAKDDNGVIKSEQNESDQKQ